MNDRSNSHHTLTAGGESIYGDTFDDESYEVKFNRRYMLASAGKKDSNGSQFFVNTVKTQWLDKKHQIFGMVLEGLETIIQIEKAGTHGGTTLKQIVISKSGTTKLDTRDFRPYEVSWRMEM
jgi:peptidylprolyl isomerase